MHTARTLKPNQTINLKTEKRKWKTNQSRKHTSSFLFVLIVEGTKEEKKRERMENPKTKKKRTERENEERKAYQMLENSFPLKPPFGNISVCGAPTATHGSPRNNFNLGPRNKIYILSFRPIL